MNDIPGPILPLIVLFFISFLGSTMPVIPREDGKLTMWEICALIGSLGFAPFVAFLSMHLGYASLLNLPFFGVAFCVLTVMAARSEKPLMICLAVSGIYSLATAVILLGKGAVTAADVLSVLGLDAAIVLLSLLFCLPIQFSLSKRRS